MQPAKPFFYFNGFNSAIPADFSGNPKITAVADYAQSRGFEFAPFSVCYRRAAEQASRVLERVGPTVNDVIICGSSMGGWFARIVQLMLARKRPAIRTAAIGFNPAYDLSMHAYLLLGPQQNYVTQERYVWTSVHSAGLRALENSIDYGSSLPFFVYIDKGDEVIDWERSAAKHSRLSHLVVFEGGCHSFDHYREALQDFDAMYVQPAQPVE